jgi:hypothetical protein
MVKRCDLPENVHASYSHAVTTSYVNYFPSFPDYNLQRTFLGKRWGEDLTCYVLQILGICVLYVPACLHVPPYF